MFEIKNFNICFRVGSLSDNVLSVPLCNYCKNKIIVVSEKGHFGPSVLISFHLILVFNPDDYVFVLNIS